MQLCPPNYYLNGVEAIYRDPDGSQEEPEELGQVYAGIRSIRCRATPHHREYVESEGTSIPEFVTRYLAYNDVTPTWHGQPFSLSQHVGHPRPMAPGIHETTMLACNNEEAIAGMTFIKKGTGPLQGLWLHCIPMPE